ncbi:hypothetical protein BX616_005870 [Lobosporangium transversale]|uniref:Cyclin-domain-containing protein n=1 Tax=Lobosporangium transversale TaxID=64571 RepID=A0A1Y2GYF9_9FUNG|nr:cyclin-domain-containing protein [Lobosporangium transversale]KAF9897283.1 hypothetical protein BX616_005870 [Lobosporangium transversale]ORZ26513.1 cyclin-domain-containing protein [Lobosporangium transversale]|eukprot:XP_021884278.1 cyclin-domain-containing protein [Lobosporangium transversale]
MYPVTTQSHLQQQQSHPLSGASSLESSYPYHHPTPPYYSQAETFQNYKGPSPTRQHQQQQHTQPRQSQQKYLATPSSVFPATCPQVVPQQQQHHRLQQRQHQAPSPLVINTKFTIPVGNINPSSGPNSDQIQSPTSNRKHQQQSIAQLAEFAAHMVCYLLYGHQPPKNKSRNSHCFGTPPSSIPSSPLPGYTTSSCPCETCRRMVSCSPARSASAASTYPSATQVQQAPQTRPTHRRILSESDIIQPKPMFRKFCLDVLSATLLSPSVVLLSLKYIQQLMINLKESNKIVNTGDGAEYRFFTGALILANKFLDDNTFTNKTWADITGMKIKDVNHLEMQFLNGIDFRLFTSSSHYSEWLANLTQFTGTYMPSQHQVAYQQQAAAAQFPLSPMETVSTVSTPVDSGTTSVRSHGSAMEISRSLQSNPSLPFSMASISNYIDNVKQLQQRSNTSIGRYQRVPSTSSAYSHQSQGVHGSGGHPSQHHQYVSLPPSSSTIQHSSGQQSAGIGSSYHGSSASYMSSPADMSYSYQQGLPEPIQRKRSANIAFDDLKESNAGYDGALPHSTCAAPVIVPTHKRFSSSSSVSALMGLSIGTPGQDVLHNGLSPVFHHQRHQQRSQQPTSLSSRASSGSLSASYRGEHQRSASGSYYIDMTGYSSTSYGQEQPHFAMSMPNSFSRQGAVHPLEKDPEYSRRPSSRADVYGAPQTIHHAPHPTGGRHICHPATPPSYPSNKCEPSCYSVECGQNMNGGGSSYDVDPRLWGPLDSLSLYAITTQAAKRVVAHSKALSSSANGLHMYYPTTLA